LKQKDDPDAETPQNPYEEEVAAIAAGIFSVLGSAAAGVGEKTSDGAVTSKVSSNWKSTARGEALR
jgi:hypothetical protein